MRLSLLFALLLIGLPACLGQDLDNVASELRSDLLGDYDNRVPPQGGAVVKIQLALYQIVEFNTPKQSLKFQGWWRHTWFDRRLVWDPEEYQGISSLVLPLSTLWVPDDLIYEVTDVKDLGNPVLTVYSSGTVFYSFPKLSTVGCNLQLKNFPFDTQVCTFTVGSMSYDGSFVDILPYDVSPANWFLDVDDDVPAMQNLTAIDLSDFQGNPEFALTRVRITSRNNYYTCCVEPYPVLMFELELQRQKLTYLSGIVIPLLCITFVGYMALLLPAPFSGSRPGFSISVMFTTSAIYLAVTRKLPDIGIYTSIGRLYLAAQCSNMLMVFVSIFVTSINVIMNELKAGRADLIQQFRFFDKDKSGHLDVHETRTALRHLGLTPKQADIVLLEYDLHPDETITVEEWIEVAAMAKKFRPLIQHNFVVGGMLALVMGGKKTYSKKRTAELDQSINQQEKLMNGGDHHDSPSSEPAISIGLEYRNFHSGGPMHLQPVPQMGQPIITDGPHLMMAPVDPLATGYAHPGQPGMMPSGFMPAGDGHPSPVMHPHVQVNGKHFGTPNGNGQPHMVVPNGHMPMQNTWFVEPVNDIISLLEQVSAPGEAYDAFVQEKIDLETLVTLNKEELAHLGIPTLGQQTKLLQLAKEKLAATKPFSGYKKEQHLEKERADALKRVGENRDRKRKSMTSELGGQRSRRGSFLSNEPVYADPEVERLHQEAYRNKHVKQLGPLIDYYALLLVPSMFILFLILEYSGANTGEAITWADVPSNEVRTLIEMQNERGSKGFQCFSNIQNIAPHAQGVCHETLSGSVLLKG